MRTCLAGVLLLALTGGHSIAQKPDAAGVAPKVSPEWAAAKRGREEADWELRHERPTIYAAGAGFKDLFERLDRDTGLPYEWVAGCDADEETHTRIAAHNERINESIKAHRLPKGSFKPWEKDLFDLKGYFAARSEIEAPVRLRSGGPARESADGQFTLRLVSAPDRDQWPAGCRYGLEIVEAKGDKDLPKVMFPWDERELELVWGPAGSAFAVIPDPLGDSMRYSALDLRRGRWLRWQR